MQYLQLLNLSVLLLFGYLHAYIYLSVWQSVGLVLFALVVEHSFLYLREGQIAYLSVSAMTTALGVVLMMVATHWWLYAVLIVIGLAQKHLLHFGMQHLFNPSNFALIVGLLLFYHETHIVMGQLGDALWLIILTLGLGSVVLWVADRWLIPIVFVVSYWLLSYFIVVCMDPVMQLDDLRLRLYSVSFIVFILFMLTDPRTTPSSYRLQALFALGISVGAVTFDYFYGFRVQHLFLALFGTTALFGVLKGYNKQKSAKGWTVVVSILVVGVIGYIQIQPPYYFEMYR